jgi:GDSL-like Lipase/Acylhydrolase family
MRSIDLVVSAPQNPAPSAGRRLKIALFFGVMLALTLGFCFGVLEFGLSRYYSGAQSGKWNGFDPTRGWALIPGTYWTKPVEMFRQFPIRVDDRGFRAHTVPADVKRPAGLLVLGDSFTFAAETPTEQIFTQQLQVLMDQRAAGVEVMNAGVQGYGTAQELLLMRELRDEHGIAPATYLLMFFTNDTLDNLCLSYGNLAPQPARPCFVLGASGELVLAQRPEKRFDSNDESLTQETAGGQGFRTVAVAKGLAEEWLQTQPSLVRMLGNVGIHPQVPRLPGLLNGWYRDDTLTPGTALTRALIRQLQLEISRSGGRLIVSMVPSPFQVYPDTYLPLLQRSFPGNELVAGFAKDPLLPQRVIAEICAEAGIPFQDLYQPFAAHNDTALFIPRDGHLNAAGHDVAAKALLEFVMPNLSTSQSRAASAAEERP